MASGVALWSTTAASNATADPTVNWSENQAASTVNDSARAMMASVAVWYALLKGGMITSGTVGGTAAAITLTNATSTVAARSAGQAYAFKLTSATTGATTLAVDGLTAGALQWRGSAIIANDYAANDWVIVIDDGTNYQLFIPPRLTAASGDYTTDATGGDVADLLYFADASQSNASNKVTVQAFFNNALTSLTQDATPDIADRVMTYDASATAAKYATISDFYKSVNALTEDTTPDRAADMVLTYDASAAGPKKAKPQNLAVIASQANMEASASGVYVAPSVQHFHPGHPKAWALFDGSVAGTNAPTAGYNVSTITRNAVGNYTANLGITFSATTAYGLGPCWARNTFAGGAASVSADPTDTKTTTAMQFRTRRSDTGAAIDPTEIFVAFFGDL